MRSEESSDPDMFLCDQIPVEYDGEEVTIWNSLTVSKHYEVRATEIVANHLILAGDGSTGEKPTYITPWMDNQLDSIGVYPNATVLDPRDDEVTVL